MQERAKILVVGDDAQQLRPTSRLLRRAGYTVSEAKDGSDSLTIAMSDNPDLVLLGTALPDLSGVEVCRRMKAEPALAGTFVVLVSEAATALDEEAESNEAVADACISLPIADRELLARVKDLLRLRAAEYALRERVKELECLYGISALVDSPRTPLTEILQGIADLIPPAWQYPEVTGVRIRLDEKEFTTPRYSRDSPWRQAADMVVRGQCRGSVEVCYVEKRPESAEGPFLAEERNLLNAITERLGRIIQRVWAEEALRESEATARALLNAPTDSATLIDTQGVILDANQTMAHRFGTSVDELVGRCVWELFPEDVAARRRACVEHVVRSGEPQRFEDNRDGIWNDNLVYPILDAEGTVAKVAVIARDITERKQRERLLQEKNDFILSVFESLAHPFYVIDADDYTVRMANSAAYRGNLPEEVKCYALTHGRNEPCRGKGHVCPVEQIKRTGKPVVVEHVHQMGGGSRRFFEVHGHPIFDDEGRVTQIIEYTLDITERVVANQALQDSEERFRIALENSNIVVYNQDRDLRYTWIYNPQLGYTPEGILGKTDADLLLPEDAARLEQIKRGVLGSGVGARETVRTIIDGVDYYYNLTVEPLRDANGDIVGITGASLDITDRKRAEDALEQSEERFRRLVETMAEGLAVLDENGIIVYVNDRLCEMSGFNERELVGRNHFELVDEHTPGLEMSAPSGLELEKPRTYETSLKRNNGQSLPVILSTSPLFDSDGSASGSFGVFTDITEQKTVAEELQRERDFVTAVLDTAGALVIVLDPQGRIVRFNRACEVLTGYTFAEVRGQHFWNLFLLPDEVGPVLEVFDELRAGQFPNRFENHWLTRDGDRRLIAWSNSALLGGAGAVEYVIGTGIDVTERRKAEDALRRSETKYRNLFEYANDAIFIVDPSTHCFLDANQNAAGSLGYTKEALLALTIEDVGAPRVAERNEPVFKQFQETGSVIYEDALVRKDGTEIPVEISSRLIDYGDQRVIQNFVRDITERRQASAALRESERKYRQLIEIAQEGVWVIDADANTTLVNPRMAEMLGYTVEEMQGQHLFAFMDERGVEISERNLERRRQGIAEQHDFEFLRKDGTRIYTSLETTPIFDNDGNYAGGLALVADITERRQAEEALRRARDELESRVKERTAELEDANRALQTEIAERKQVEAELRLSEEMLEQRVKGRTRELSTLLEISRNVALTHDLVLLLDLILNQLEAVVEYDDASIFRFEGDELSVIAHRGAVAQENMLSQRFSLSGAPFGRELILNRETVVIADVRDDSPLAQEFRTVAGERFDRLYGRVRSWLSVPLMVKDQIVGILTLKHGEADHFKPDQAELVLGFANQIAVALENNRLYEQAQELAALEERQRLARDLHDAVSQTLFSASLAAEVLPRLWETRPEEGRECLTEVRQLTRGALAEMRTLLLELRPSGLVEVALDDLVKQLVEAASNRARIPIDLVVEGACALQPEVQITLYRIAQEALSNIVKHADAEKATVGIRCAPADPALGSGLTENVELWIEDNGCGFDPQNVPAECLGVSIMQERTAAIGADIEITSTADHGTRVRVAWSAPDRDVS